MQEMQSFFPDDLYSQHLSTIRNIPFTHREVDVMACLLGGRKTSKIAYLLSVNPRTVETYIQNISLKLECNTREGIIDFLELSDQIPFLRKHYLYLQIDYAFRKGLTDLSKLMRKEDPLSVIIRGEKEALNSPLIPLLKAHLKLAGLTIVKEGVTEHGHLIYVLPPHVQQGSLSLQQIINQYPKNKLLLMLEQDEQKLPKEFKGFKAVNVKKYQNYYFVFFNIIKIIFPNIKIDSIVSDFKEKYEKVDHVRKSEYSLQPLSQAQHEDLPFLEGLKDIMPTKILVVGLTLLIISLISIGFYWQLEHNSRQQPFALSELPLPTKSVFLERPEFLHEIDKSFAKAGDIQTIALVGIGGAGKTTLARQYARNQKESVIWEINAETKSSLYESFDNLAHALAKTEEDKKILRGLLETKNSRQKKEKLINFVKERLKLHSPWFLVFDNVENFEDIQKYFPQDPKIWGEGKVILTTRNMNIQNSHFTNKVISIGELTPKQKQDLFVKIMNSKKLYHKPDIQVSVFLNHIPPFPLDISIAAYYLKSINISYAKYIENIKNHKKEVSELQENVLKENGEYIRTRYAIVTHSLEHLIEKHTDFIDLLLFISLLDSQNIPKSLLDQYKDSNIVDNFIYYLKKHSFITSQILSDHSEPMYSMHRSSQTISLTYLIEFLKLNRDSAVLKKIASLLDDYVAVRIIVKEEFFRIKTLLRHLNFFLKNEELLDCNTRGFIKGNIGILLLYLSLDIKAQQYLKESLDLIIYQKENYTRIARYSGYLGISYRELGDYKNAKNYLEKSLQIYQEHVDEDQQDLSWILVNLGALYAHLEDFKNAKKYMKEALEVSKKKNLNDATRMAWVLGHLASIESSLGNNTQAKALFEQCLAIYEKNYELNHPKRAWILIGLGIVFRNLSDYEMAKELIEEGIKIQRTCFSEDSLKVILSKLELARVYLLEGKLNMAETLLNQSLRGLEKNEFKDIYIPLEILGDLYLKKEKDMINRGEIEKTQKFKVQAKKYFNQAMENIKTRFPINSPQLMRIENKLRTF